MQGVDPPPLLSQINMNSFRFEGPRPNSSHGPEGPGEVPFPQLWERVQAGQASYISYQ